MSLQRTVLSIVFVSVLSLPLSAQAESPLLDVTCTMVDVQGEPGVRVVTDSDDVLVEPNGQSMFPGTLLTCSAELVPAEGGFDLDVTVRNETDHPLEYPQVALPGIRLSSEEVTWLSPKQVGHWHSGVSYPDGHIRSYVRWYPNDSYSPVMFVEDDRFAIGSALLYDVLAEKRGVRMTWHSEGGIWSGTFAMRWQLAMPEDVVRTMGDFNGDGQLNGLDISGFKTALATGRDAYLADTGIDANVVGDFNVDGAFNGLDIPAFKRALGSAVQTGPQQGNLIAAGGEYRCTLTFRFAEPGRHLEVLEPYRQFFRARYGGVTYQADKRPVFGQPTGLVKFVGDDNPRGFSPEARLDLEGWQPFVDSHVAKLAGQGYARFMIWCPSGLYQVGSNFPVEFMTGWTFMQCISLGELDRLRAVTPNLGFWWGRSSQVSGGWNTGEIWTRDIDDPADCAAGYAELELARQRGAYEVGLDAFSYIPLWDRVTWMKAIQRDFPELRFITEPSDVDIMHTLAPTFCLYSQQNQPAVLADWLNPGHETWVQMKWQEVNAADFFELIDRGLVPCTMSRTVAH